MSCQVELGEHVIQQSPRRPDLRLRRLSPTNNPQNRLLHIPSVLSPVLQRTKGQVMSLFNYVYVISARACTKLAFFFLIDTFHPFLLVIADDAHTRVRRSPNVPQPQTLLHPPILLLMTVHLPHRPRVSRSRCTCAAPSSRQLLSRVTSRRSSCCQNTSISWNGWQ